MRREFERARVNVRLGWPKESESMENDGELLLFLFYLETKH